MKPSELLSKRGAWTQGTLARTKSGVRVQYFDADACSWCLVGALEKCGIIYFDLMVMGKLGFASSSDAVKWNDTPGRKKSEVIELLKSVGL